MEGLLRLILAAAMVGRALPSPIFLKLDPSIALNPVIPKDYCSLYPELGYEGNVTFIEDCRSLDRFPIFPMPGDPSRKLGVHTVVCCPRYLPPTAICFPSDAWCPTYVPPVYEDYEEENPAEGSTNDEYNDYYYEEDKVQTVVSSPKMSDRTCEGLPIISLLPNRTTTATCVGINRCPAMVDNERAPETHIITCGFDESENILMVCCPVELVEEAKEVVQKPRFPRRGSARARKCEDKTNHCKRWKENQGCRLDVHITVSKEDPYNGQVESKAMFEFMQTACPLSCGWCGRKGCVDEHPRCPSWSRKGMCVTVPNFMAHTCRESCGVCGFLSPTNKEEQKVGSNSYSDIDSPTFDCGRYKPLCEINNVSCEEPEPEVTPNTTTTTTTTTTTPASNIDTGDFDLRTPDVFFSSDPDPKNPGEFFCGATMISDRWVVAAAHCYDDFATGVSLGQRKVRVNTIRDGTPSHEIVEIKRIYKHPEYKYPRLYNDVAVLELGRRVEYNYEKFGDTPSCLDKGISKIGKIATVQGYGLTETGTKGSLLETNVTVISNSDCKTQLQGNTTEDIVARKKIFKALPIGLEYGLMCAQGIYKPEEDIFSGACKGDSGGPLTIVDEGRTKLVGIVSGGIDCGKGFPGWYTRVEYFKDWIRCIIDQSIRFDNVYYKVEEVCNKLERSPKKLPICEEVIQEADAALFDLRTLGLTPEDACEAYNTGVIIPEKQPVDEIFGSAGLRADDTSSQDDTDEIFGDSNEDEDPSNGEDAEIFGDNGGDDEIFGDVDGGDEEIFSK